MAQPKVTSFFNVRKRNADLQPSKRQKLEIVADTESTVQQDCWSSSKTRSIGARTRRGRAKIEVQANLNAPSKAVDQTPDIVTTDSTGDLTMQIVAEVTAACDDNNASPPSTPTKRATTGEKIVRAKRGRSAKTVQKDLLKTPEQYDFTRFVENDNSKSARKKLIMEEVPMPKSLSPKHGSPKQKLDAATVRVKLTATRKLTDVQDQLAQYSMAVKRVKEARNQALLKQEHEADVQVSSTPATVSKADTKSTADIEPAPASSSLASGSVKAPAYQHLAPPSTLVLPYKYMVLGEMFRSADTVVSMLYKRSETCTFSKLRTAVQKMTSKNFEERHLGQIKTVYPTAYELRQAKGLPKLGYQDLKKGEYQLTVEPVLNKETCTYDNDVRPAFTAHQMISRENIFHRALVAIVKKFHKKFLSSLDRPLTVDDDKLTLWDPRFKLDEVPDIAPADLPKSLLAKKLTTAKEVLEQARGTLNPRIERAFKAITDLKEDQMAGNTTKATEKTSTPKKTEAAASSPRNPLQGISSSLLERIRAKARLQQVAAMTCSPAEQLRRDRIQRLPELCRILHSYFVTRRKPAVLREDAVAKMSESYRTELGVAETEHHLELMVELLPEWIQIVKVSRGQYIKIDKNKNVGLLVQKLDSMERKNV